MGDGLSRFVDAQAGVYAAALQELRDGRKRTHWMWFVFPQLRGLGHSDVARRHAIDGLDEARAYLRHPLLGPRLAECTQAMLAHAGTPLAAILGFPDDLKFVSCMTLFDAAGGPKALFARALDAFNGGVADAATLRLLGPDPVGQ
ncbi:MAG: DUF1810 domain-containing protein [Thermomonas sp.]